MADELLFHVTKDFVFFVTNQICRQISIIIRMQCFVRIVPVLENVYPVLCRRDDTVILAESANDLQFDLNEFYKYYD